MALVDTMVLVLALGDAGGQVDSVSHTMRRVDGAGWIDSVSPLNRTGFVSSGVGSCIGEVLVNTAIATLITCGVAFTSRTTIDSAVAL